MNQNFTFSGFVSVRCYGEAEDILFLKGEDDPLADVLEDTIAHKFVSVKYYICSEKISLEDAEEYLVKLLCGESDFKFEYHYSEITGYLWTDEEINIGGHDLLSELKGHKGKYLILIIDASDEDPRINKE